MPVILNTSFHCADTLSTALEDWLKEYSLRNPCVSPKTFRILTEINEGVAAYAIQTEHHSTEEAQTEDSRRQAEFIERFGADVQGGRIVAFSSLLEPLQ